MNVRRYFARTAREAMARVRAELGDDAVVLKNQPIDGGVEILALAGSELDWPTPDTSPAASQSASRMTGQMHGGAHGSAHEIAHDRLRESAAAGALTTNVSRSGEAENESRGARSSMSTVHFENYVRERQQKRLRATVLDHDRSDSAPAPLAAVTVAAAAVAPAVGARPGDHAGGGVPPGTPPGAPRGAAPGAAPGAPADALVSAPLRAQPNASHDVAAAKHVVDAALPDAAQRIDTDALLAQMRRMQGALSDQLEAMNWFEGVRRRPAQSRMLRHLLQSGFSPSLSRTLANHLPADFGDGEAARWLRDVLARNLRIDTPEQTIFDAGGTFALLGPTGVGKTTTAAKIAAQFALRHGAQSVGLITADVYRIGAQDQLRTFGRLLGVPVHVAHDVSALAGFLQMCMNRKLVLIDTAGVAQHDERVGELLAALSSAQVRKVLVLNAAAQAEAIDETITAYRGRDAAGVVLAKVDEAVRLGGALDCLIRHRLTLQGVANGQRVPEDWHRPESNMLVERALSTESSRIPASFAFEEAELAMLLSAGQGSSARNAVEAAHV